MVPVKQQTPQKPAVPPPGRKMSTTEARAHVLKQYAPVFEKLAQAPKSDK